ncbi:type II secretion system F family protein [Gemmatimonas groenlandica]|uniref:Type II secretion system F family protein n=1 Tax=Gemmatimonas groenlandica TaxID=2732249 RepID=A0A6M4IVI9_9BACT|nr:type II secretion system F family protein [Gemmatimonas groenlandica]QJR37759.1 type II secretion system F family protein [Gemmatimonas groenlandica]
MGDLPLSLLFLVGTVILAVCTIVYVAISERERRETMQRVSPESDPSRMAERLLLNEDAKASSRLAAWLRERMPEGLISDDASSTKLVHAGFDGSAAPVIFSAIRIAAALLLPVLAFVAAPRDEPMWLTVSIVMGVVAGIAGPQAVVDRLAQNRQDRIRRAVPDALDLLVVCVEAGVSLDAAIIRVARDLANVRPELALEFAQVVRRVNAGMPRDRALQTLAQRTGVDELRTLVSSMVQTERLGTSIARVLRVNSDSLRVRRRQKAEKKAAEAALKMIFPLALFLLPALLAVIVGPAALTVVSQLGNLSK